MGKTKSSWVNHLQITREKLSSWVNRLQIAWVTTGSWVNFSRSQLQRSQLMGKSPPNRVGTMHSSWVTHFQITWVKLSAPR